MRAFSLFAALLLLASGCSLVVDDCLYDDFGCSLPGRWQLVSVNGEAVASGSVEINAGFIDRDGYLDLPTGLEPPANPDLGDLSRIRGPFLGTYSGYVTEDETRTFRFDASLTGVPCSIGNCLVSLYTRFGEMEEDRFTLVVSSVDDDLVPGLAQAPYLRQGTVLAFRRSGR